MKNFLRIIIKNIYKLFVLIVYRPKIVGEENIPKETAAIICPNHVHALDSTIIISMHKRKINVLAKEELFTHRGVKPLANIFGIYPVRKDSKSMETMKVSLKVLKNKELLLIFPEGTRNGMAKGVKPKDGAVKLAIKTNAPIIPIGIKGDFKPFRRVVINIGKPVDYSEYKKEINNKELLDKLSDELMLKTVNLKNDNTIK